MRGGPEEDPGMSYETRNQASFDPDRVTDMRLEAARKAMGEAGYMGIENAPAKGAGIGAAAGAIAGKRLDGGKLDEYATDLMRKRELDQKPPGMLDIAEDKVLQNLPEFAQTPASYSFLPARAAQEVAELSAAPAVGLMRGERVLDFDKVFEETLMKHMSDRYGGK